MKSRRSWLIGLALGAALSFGAPSAHAQTWKGGPRLISYQGLLLNNGQKVTGQHVINIDIYNANAPLPLYSEPHTVNLTAADDGVFNINIGDQNAGTNELPEGTLKFDEPYWI